MKIGLIPLDERPVNTRYPAMIAQIAGVDLCLPPTHLLSQFRQPADIDGLIGWLFEQAGGLDALIVSIEMLGYGSLIASRISQELPGEILARLEALSKLKQNHPRMELIGFNLITRVSNADSAIEEPDYWASEGRRFYQFSQLLDRLELGEPVSQELAELSGVLPANHIQDFLQRRLRNHTVNLAVIHLLAQGVLNGLVLSSDDTSPFGLPSSEKRHLGLWLRRLGLENRLLMYPGADEVGSALLARVFNQQAGFAPAFRVSYAVPGGEAIVAPYEDSPVSVTIERQIRAVGGSIVAQKADFWLAVNPPAPRRSEWSPEYAEQERNERLPYLKKMAAEIQQRLEAGEAVIVADVAYPNGADPVLIELLLERVDITRLAAYGAWNTAGNTIGTALSQGCASRLARTPEQQSAQQRFLLHRFVEDWGYQQVVRRAAWRWLWNEYGRDELDAEILPEVIAFITAGLERRIEQLPGFRDVFRLASGSVRLPWNRLFEVDFELETANH